MEVCGLRMYSVYVQSCVESVWPIRVCGHGSHACVRCLVCESSVCAFRVLCVVFAR